MFKKQTGQLTVRVKGLKARVYDLNIYDVGWHADIVHVLSRDTNETIAVFPDKNIQAVEIHPQIEGLTK